MKKTAIIMLAMLPAMMGWSQDTVTSPLKENYLFNKKPVVHTEYAEIGGALVHGNQCGVTTKELYCGGRSLTVYGIAAAMMTEKDLYVGYVPAGEDSSEWMSSFVASHRDTTIANLYEYLGVYLQDADSLVLQREVMVHRRDDTPAYYVETGLYNYHNPNFVYPMYEKYFDSAIFIARDTFYVGTTQYTHETATGVHDHMGFMLLGIQGSNEYHVSKYCHPEEGRVYWYWPVRPQTDHYYYYLIFPILTPEPDSTGSSDTTGTGGDTTGTGGDTLAVTQADMVGRYVTVQPNPAVDEARVLSSFGLERIEAYNAEGRLVFKQEATGLEATLDVKGWPRGTYLLRITTPMGAVTKKLLVN